MDSIREMIISKSLGPVEVSRGVQDLLNEYAHNKEVFDDSYSENPMYALLKIMAYTRRCAYTIAKKNFDSYASSWGTSAKDNYIVYRLYMRDFEYAYDSFNRLFVLTDEEKERLDDVRRRLEGAISLTYDDNTYLMIDIFDINSDLYKIEGIGYAR